MNIHTVTSNSVILGYRDLSKVESKYAKFWGHLITLVCFIVSKSVWLESTHSKAPFVAVLYAILFESVDLNSNLCFRDACFKSRLEQVIQAVFNEFYIFSRQLFCTCFTLSFWPHHNICSFLLNAYSFLCKHTWVLIFPIFLVENFVFPIQIVCVNLSAHSLLVCSCELSFQCPLTEVQNLWWEYYDAWTFA